MSHCGLLGYSSAVLNEQTTYADEEDATCIYLLHFCFYIANETNRAINFVQTIKDCTKYKLTFLLLLKALYHSSTLHVPSHHFSIITFILKCSLKVCPNGIKNAHVVNIRNQIKTNDTEIQTSWNNSNNSNF